jgi:hypothetical protein
MIRRLPTLAALAAIAILATPALAAAAGPTLTATVIPGQEIDLAGSGFPADADVQLVILRNGEDSGSQTLHTNASGNFTATIDAGPGRGGEYTATATSGSATATVEALAVETAGGLQASPPPTDEAAPGRSGSGDDGFGRLAILAMVFASGLGVALATFRAVRSRH